MKYKTQEVFPGANSLPNLFLEIWMFSYSPQPKNNTFISIVAAGSEDFIKIISAPNMGFELRSRRSRVACSTELARCLQKDFFFNQLFGPYHFEIYEILHNRKPIFDELWRLFLDWVTGSKSSIVLIC